jgi:TPR repeat protein
LPAPAYAPRPADPEKERAAREKADQKALEFEKRRADQDYGWAQYSLGLRYWTGRGVEKDLEEAHKWLEKAAKNGESQAVKKLPELKKELDGVASGIVTTEKPRSSDPTPDPASNKRPDLQSSVGK